MIYLEPEQDRKDMLEITKWMSINTQTNLPELREDAPDDVKRKYARLIEKQEKYVFE